MTEPIDDIHAMCIEATREIRELHAAARQRMLAGYPDVLPVGETKKGGDIPQ